MCREAKGYLFELSSIFVVFFFKITKFWKLLLSLSSDGQNMDRYLLCWAHEYDHSSSRPNLNLISLLLIGFVKVKVYPIRGPKGPRVGVDV
jgi:hypothetical protein